MEWIIAIVIVLFLSKGVFCCLEMVFVSAKVPLLRDIASKGNTSAKVFVHRRVRPERTFAVIQVGITPIGALSAAIDGAEDEATIFPFLQ